jgi:hypothetical protein
MRLRPLFCIVLTVSPTAPVESQTVRGRVVEDSTLASISQATVELLAPGGRAAARATTDTGGYFLLRAPSDITYDLRVLRLGFAEGRLTGCD